jgi:hypothetical protein
VNDDLDESFGALDESFGALVDDEPVFGGADAVVVDGDDGAGDEGGDDAPEQGDK